MKVGEEVIMKLNMDYQKIYMEKQDIEDKLNDYKLKYADAYFIKDTLFLLMKESIVTVKKESNIK